MVLLQQDGILIEAATEISYDNSGRVIRAFLFEHSHEQILMQEEIMQPRSSYLICATPFDGSTFLE